MSAPLLMLPRKENHIFDDLESFLHVLELMGIRFYRHSHSALKRGVAGEWIVDPSLIAQNLQLPGEVLTKYFAADRHGPHTTGGTRKYYDLVAGFSAFNFEPRGVLDPQLGPLPKTIKKWYDLLQPRYKAMNLKAWTLLWGPDDRPEEFGQEDEQRCRALIEDSALYKLRHKDLEDVWLKGKDLDDHRLTSWDGKIQDQLAGMLSVTGVPLVTSSVAGSSHSRLQAGAF